MKLVALRILPRGPSGWESRNLLFADSVTQLFGPNGSGKTPLVQAIVFALGYKVEFRDDIVENCESVRLEIRSNEQTYVLHRKIGGRSDVSVEREGGIETFSTLEDYSKFILSLWGIETGPVLTSVRGAPASLYVEHLLPLFYLDQDHGYADPYYTTSKFVKDQYAEMMRLLFGLGPKHSFDRKRARLSLGERLDYVDRIVVRTESLIAELASELGEQRRPLIEIDAELDSAVLELEHLRESSDFGSRAADESEYKRAAILRQRRDHLRELADISLRIRGYAQIKHEIEVEADTLSLNEGARRVFASFESICAKEGCGLFMQSSTSYGKSLLYLRDQLKDLDRNNEAHESRALVLAEHVSNLDAELVKISARQAESNKQSPVSALVTTVSELTERVIRLKRLRTVEAELARTETQYVSKLEERKQVQQELAILDRHSTAADLELVRARTAFGERIVHWLKVLRTSNVSLDVQVDNDFNVTFGGQKVGKFKGSTLTRIILAIRTAAFDISCSSDNAFPRFLILDTPRQQDISREDLAQYIDSIKSMSALRSSQVVFSTTNYRYDLGDHDVDWEPDYPGTDHSMFLGVPGSTN